MASQATAACEQHHDSTAASAASKDTVVNSSAPTASDESNTCAPNETAHKEATPETPDNPRLSALAAKRANLESTLTSLQQQSAALVTDVMHTTGRPVPDCLSEEEKTAHAVTTANSVIKDHIALLHRYNEIKDIGLGLMGLIADKRGVRVAGIMEEFGVGEKD